MLNYELLMSGISSGRSVIDIKATSENRRVLLRSFHPVHILSGCDTVSQMYGIGKGKASEDDRQLELENLTNSYIPIIDQVIEEASKYVVECYRTRETNMLAAMYDIWTSKLANKKRKSAHVLKVLPHTNSQVAIWWSPLKSDAHSLNPVNMDGHWICQHKLCTRFHCLLMCHLHH